MLCVRAPFIKGQDVQRNTLLSKFHFISIEFEHRIIQSSFKRFPQVLLQLPLSTWLLGKPACLSTWWQTPSDVC